MALLKVSKLILILVLALGLRGVGFAEEGNLAQEESPAQEELSPKSPALEAQDSLPEPAVESGSPKEEIREKSLNGEISGVSSNFIAIVYGQDERTAYEMAFNITKDTRLERIQDLKALKPGDTVWVNYTEKVLIKGKEVRVMERILKVLRFLNSAKLVIEPFVPTDKIATEAVE